ncbi:MAG: adenylate cyclase [bacterium TMED198]|nr:MAG: adenylate cyclase [bacterium TMED198]|tara:strand:+ start:848 stop:1315 length:468 start_codon:yes stop_codon:yes gene_type:complete
MKNEIEKKFLVVSESYKEIANEKYKIKQGYISETKKAVTRVRISNKAAYITIKENKKEISKLEFEYSIPIKEGQYLIENLCNDEIITKTRYIVEFEGFLWEVDEFKGKNKGLVIAEIELEGETQKFSKPKWIGDEVTNDERYYNINLMMNPFQKW